MLYEIFESAVNDGETTMERTLIGTIEKKYIDTLSEYLVDKCGYVEDEPRKFSRRVIVESHSGEKTVIHRLARYMEISEAVEMGFIRPDNFDQVELPVDDSWSDIDINSTHEVSKGLWVSNTYNGSLE